ncbi:uncharacterized protein LOC132264958 isoform X2 [Phlebotomus argentipes]|uniref:uncharacterized protein LOC132264958 isoform X2 n=1 Tax=Phlebotomus argentipes TaxID=94469 RepID=UPI002893176C|nr:uncharacterized protein LOC132264958 isoform X2 [Phlebotomus argentipes]
MEHFRHRLLHHICDGRPIFIILPSISNFEHFDDGQLKALLDEAITYKTPKDREHKSEAFKKLLQRAEIQEQALELNYEFKASRQSGGSLQDLANPADVDFFGSSMNHQRKHHNSRQKKYSTTSVSSRQREGGSLPSNVNVATNHLLCEATQPFLSEKRGGGGGGGGVRKVVPEILPLMFSAVASDLVEKRERKLHGGGGDVETSVVLVRSDGKIRISDDVQHHEHDTLLQNHGDVGGESYDKNSLNKIPRANYTSQKKIDLTSGAVGVSAVDTGVEFAQFTGQKVSGIVGREAIEMTSPLQLNSSYNSVSSVVTPSTADGGKSVQASLTHKIPAKQGSRDKTDENGNSVNTFNATATVTVPQQPQQAQLQSQTAKTKKKISKSERNTITKNSHEIDGFRGRDNIDTLVRFIESSESTRKKKKSNGGTSVPLVTKKEKNGGGKKDGGDNNNKLKKSNSMDELSSSSKLEEIARAESSGVTLRAKNAKKAVSETTPLLAGAAAAAHKGAKRGERRSWGTEELSYLGESDVMAVAEQPKKEKSSKAAAAAAASKELSLVGGNLKQKKDDQQSLSVESMSATYEMAEFHVVTKKKKAKKRQNIIVTPLEVDARVTPKKQQDQRQEHTTSGGQQNRAKAVYNHQTSSHFTNDRDVYVNDRRKSTSSVPPSEKSDSSDLDSVHSLPVESSLSLGLSVTTSSTPPQASYADIARIANVVSQEQQQQRFQLKDNWPAMPLRHSSGNQETVETASTNSGSTTASYKSQSSVVLRSVPVELSDGDEGEKRSPVMMNGVIQASVADVIKSSMEGGKSQLQKSKSVENDTSAYFSSIDHYPALEKTVKSKQQQQQAAKSVVPNVEMTTKKSKSIVSSNSSVSVSSNNLSSNCNASVSPNLAVKMSLVDQLKSPALVSSVSRSENMPRESEEITVTKSHKVKQTKAAATATAATEERRPAVIILNDNDRYQLNEGITFGFDINSQLLFGDFNENELHLLESSDAGYDGSSASTEPHDATTDTSASEAHLNHSSDDSGRQTPPGRQDGEEEEEEEDEDVDVDEEDSDKCDPMPILKACVSVQTSMEHLYVNDTTPTVRVEERDSSIIASIPAQIAFTHADDSANIMQIQRRMCGKKLNVRYVAPAGEELILTTYNHDKIVNFVGLAWENVAGNDGVKYYDGQ